MGKQTKVRTKIAKMRASRSSQTVNQAHTEFLGRAETCVRNGYRTLHEENSMLVVVSYVIFQFWIKTNAREKTHLTRFREAEASQMNSPATHFFDNRMNLMKFKGIHRSH